VNLIATNLDANSDCRIAIVDHMRGSGSSSAVVKAGRKKTILLELKKTFFWYDFSVTVANFGEFARRFAGRVETGRAGYSDPVMGRSIGFPS
jgi:phospholipase C